MLWFAHQADRQLAYMEYLPFVNGHLCVRICINARSNNKGLAYYLRASFSFWCLHNRVADPDLPDPHFFGPPGSGSGSISQRYGSGSGSGSGSFYHRIWILPSPSKKSKKNLDSYCFVTSFDFLSLKMMYGTGTCTFSK